MSDFTLVGAGVVPYRQRVRVEGQAETFSIGVTEFENVSARSRLSFTWTSVAADIGAAGTILLLQNISATLILHIEDISVTTDNASEVDLHFTNEAALTHSGTNVVGVCINRNGPRDAVLLSTATANEANNVQGNIFWTGDIPAGETEHIHWGGAVILGTNDIVAVDLTTASTNLASATIAGFYTIPDEARQ